MGDVVSLTKRKRAEKKKGNGGAPPPAGPGERDAIGEGVAEVNRDWALVRVGGKALVLHEGSDAWGKPSLQFYTVGEFCTWWENRRYFDPEMERTNSLGRLWLKHQHRRQFKGVEFAPEGLPEGWYNLWQGFAVHPAAPYADFRDHAKHFPTLYDHVLSNIAQGRKDLAHYVWSWAADLIQHPTVRRGISLVFRGEMGAGKSTFGEAIGGLLGPHYTLVEDAAHLVGQFNGHMANCLLLQADEAVWAGDKQAEGKLKSLVTSGVHLIEKKGVDAVPVRNLIRLIMTSNNSWVVPAGPKERRFAVIDIGEGRLQDRAYFSKLFAELDAGGREHLLAYLLAFPLDPDKLAELPRTEALWEQKMASFDPHVAWWFEALQRGAVVYGGREWPDRIASDAVYRSYETFAERLGVRRKMTSAQLGTELRKLMPKPWPKVGKVWIDDHQEGPMGEPIHTADGKVPRKRVNGYELPGLHMCRNHFAAFVRHEIQWPEDDLNER